MELRRGMYGFLLDLPSCDVCPGAAAGDCTVPVGLTYKGQLVEFDDDSVSVAWPGCPNRWHVLRRWGQELLPLSEIVRWTHEVAFARIEDLSAGAQRLIRDWLVQRDRPGQIAEAKAIEKAKTKGSKP